MKSRFERLSKPEIDFLIDNCNFSTEEEMIIKMANIGNGDIQIATQLNISTSSVTKKKKKIENKIFSFVEVSKKLTTIYVNGKRVTKDELKETGIDVENVSNMIIKKLTER